MNQLSRTTWKQVQSEHHRIVEPWIRPRLERRSHHLKHPVDDFLFEYYPISPARIRTWHPGIGNSLEATIEDQDDFPQASYVFDGETIAINQMWLEEQSERFAKILELLKATQQRPSRTGCFGLHEWAMVVGDDTVRHADWKLRLTDEEIRATIDAVGLRCTHFDAFRFFTDEARPHNPLQLTRSDQMSFEQPGCLHANMDLHKYASAIAPIIGSEIARDSFALAREIRTVDMQVAPYELSALGITPIPVETAEGRLEFASRQQQFTLRANELRERLIAALEPVLKGNSHTNQ